MVLKNALAGLKDFFYSICMFADACHYQELGMTEWMVFVNDRLVGIVGAYDITNAMRSAVLKYRVCEYDDLIVQEL